MIAALPQSDGAMLTSRISLRISCGTVGRPPALSISAPIQSEATRCHFDYGLRLNNRQRIANAGRSDRGKQNHRSMELKLFPRGLPETFIC